MNVATSPGRKDDTGKIRVDLLPAGALLEVGKVLTFGAKKYQAENTWQNVTPFWPRYLAALTRHLFAIMRGEVYDPESGLYHMAHLTCCALFLLSSLVGHDKVERLPAPARVPSNVGKFGDVLAGLKVENVAMAPSQPGAIGRAVIHTENPDPSPTSATIPSQPNVPRHMTSVPVTFTDPDKDPPPSYQAEPDPFPPCYTDSPSTLRSSARGTEFIRPDHVVIPKAYHVLHMRSGHLEEEARADDAPEAYQSAKAFEAFSKDGDIVTVIKLGMLVYTKRIAHEK